MGTSLLLHNSCESCIGFSDCLCLFVFSFLEFQILAKNPKSDFSSFVGCANGNFVLRMSFGVMRKMEEIGEVEEEEEEEENNNKKKQVVDRMGMSSSNEGEEFGGTIDVFRRENRVTLQFKLPLYTQWGQNLLLVGSDPLLGSWDLARAKHMLPRHEGDAQLIWEVGVSVPANLHSQYSYCMVDEHMNVLKWEAGARRSLELPEGLENGAVVEVHDQWQVGGTGSRFLRSGRSSQFQA